MFVRRLIATSSMMALDGGLPAFQLISVDLVLINATITGDNIHTNNASSWSRSDVTELVALLLAIPATVVAVIVLATALMRRYSGKICK